ncbi:MAG TPA: iron-dependent repressor [Bacteroidetes bacterium]|nr:iron-dependent repressor [Bacteroidota bacterium]|tara:strand:+ start:1082 stop:1750 length:669 start_codon:yes stop_codon:yes gene_type:complete
MPSQSIEDYLKAIWTLSEGKEDNYAVSTNDLASHLMTSQASVSEMYKRLAGKEFIDYVPYRGGSLSPKGRQLALSLIRKHRLWEVFLHEKLGFGWEEVHDIAEQLEHVHSQELIKRLDTFLEHPSIDPHGDYIPDAEGNILKQRAKPLTELTIGIGSQVVGVLDSNSKLLSLLSQKGIALGTSLCIQSILPFDDSRVLTLNEKQTVELSYKACELILIQENR